MGLDTANKHYGIGGEKVKTNVDFSDGTDFTVKKRTCTRILHQINSCKTNIN